MRVSKQFHSLDGVLNGISSQWGMQRDLALYKLAQDWSTVVGSPISLHSFPEKIRFHTLTLGVDSAPWKSELLFFKTEILNKVNAFFKKSLVSDIFFRVIAPYPRPKSLSTPPKKKERLKMPQEVADLEDAIHALNDKALQQAIRQVLIHYFSPSVH